jgi:hypothetical protein
MVTILAALGAYAIFAMTLRLGSGQKRERDDGTP